MTQAEVVMKCYHEKRGPENVAKKGMALCINSVYNKYINFGHSLAVLICPIH